VAPVQELPLIGDELEHPLEAVVGEFDHAAAPLADEVLVGSPLGRRLEAAVAVAEIVFPYQAAFDQQVERAVDGRGADADAPARKLAADALGGRMVDRTTASATETLPSDGKPAVAQVPVKRSRRAGRRRQPAGLSSGDSLAGGNQSDTSIGTGARPRRPARGPARAAPRGR
jgi:hypothetical protein